MSAASEVTQLRQKLAKDGFKLRSEQESGRLAYCVYDPRRNEAIWRTHSFEDLKLWVNGNCHRGTPTLDRMRDRQLLQRKLWGTLRQQD